MDTLSNRSVIEDGIPVPPTGNDYSVLDLLKPGQSVVLPGIPVQRAFNAGVRRAAKFPGRTYTCRTIEGGIRVWRVS